MFKWLFFFLFLIFINEVQGQNTIGLPQIINFSNNTFKGGSQTWDIKQDKAGRMYFANNEGLLTYDGSYWKIYPQPNKTILRSIALDRGRIYAGGQDEIGYFFPDSTGSLKYTSLKHLIPKKFTDVWDIEVLNDAVFFRTWDQIFEYKNEAVKVYTALTGWDMMKLAGNKLFAQDKTNGLFQFISDGWQPLCKQNAVPNYEITGIVALHKDSLLLSSLQNGLFIYSNGSITKKNTQADDHFFKSSIYCFEQINNTEFVAGTISEGCLIMNMNGDIVQQIALPEGLQNNNVLYVFLDREKNLWVALDNGISFIAYNSAIKYIKPGKPNELAGYSARIFDNQLYVATSDGAYAAPISNSTKNFSFSKGNFSFVNNSNGQAWRLDEINHQLLMGHNKGSYLIKKNDAVQITHDAGIWLFVPTSSIFPVKNILAGSYAGLTMLEFADTKITSTHELKGMYESLRFLAIDNSNTIWASHPYRGIYKITLAADNKSYTHELLTDKNGLPSASRNFGFRIKNRVVFATEKGIYEYDNALKRFIRSPLLYQVFGDLAIQYLNEDAEGHIWFCSGKKIGVVNYSDTEKKYRMSYFPELTGKLLSGFENIYPYDNKNIFIASNNGIIHVDYDKYVTLNHKVNILLTQVKSIEGPGSIVFGGYFDQQADSNYYQNKNAIRQFSKSNNSFHFEFSSPSYDFQNNIEYSYQLEGYENEWSDWGPKTEKDYTNLPHGNFTFKVKARDNLGHESAPVNYRFEINPAWYKSPIAYILYLVFFIIFLYVFDRWQKQRFHIRQLKFEEEQKKMRYILQLEVEKNEKKIIELENEKLVNEVIYKNKELSDASIRLMERSDALLKVKDELQKLNKKTGDNQDLKKAIQLLTDAEKDDSNWEQFVTQFNKVNNNFLKKLGAQFPKLTNADLKVCAYVQLKMSSKEIAHLMNMAVRGVEIIRYRLRKKLQLAPGQSLKEFLNDIHEAHNSL